MTRIRGVWHWQQIVSTHLPCLSRPQVATLALWSPGTGATDRQWHD
jgi:hypothetical protein